MGLTLKPVTYEPRSDGTVSVAIRITLQRQVKYWSTGLVMLPKHINPDGTTDKRNWIRRSFEAHERANRTIRDRLIRAEEIHSLVSPHLVLTAASLRTLLEKLDAAGMIRPVAPDYPPLSWEQVRSYALTDSAGESFSDFYDRLIRGKGDTAAGEHQRVLFSQLHTFFGRWDGGSSVKGKATAPIHFSELTLERLLEFKIWLAGTLKLGLTTLHNKHVRLEEVITMAIKAGKLTNNPLDAWDTPKGRPDRSRLTDAEWAKLEALLPTLKGTAYHALQIFRYQFYAQGKRIGDAMKLVPERIDDDRLFYRTTKVGKLKSMQLHPKLKTIVLEYLAKRTHSDWPDHHGVPCPYLFPFLKYDVANLSRADQRRMVNLQTGTVNYHLKNLIKQLGINKSLSSHVARHSFADSARRATGAGGEKLFDVYDISKALGHSSIATTEIYLATFDEVAVDRVNRMYYREEAPETGLKQSVESDVIMSSSES